MYAWGTGDDGQLGLPLGEKSGITQSYVEFLPKLVEPLSDKGIVQLSASTNHSAAVTSDGKVLVWGKVLFATTALLLLIIANLPFFDNLERPQQARTGSYRYCSIPGAS